MKFIQIILLLLALSPEFGFAATQETTSLMSSFEINDHSLPIVFHLSFTGNGDPSFTPNSPWVMDIYGSNSELVELPGNTIEPIKLMRTIRTLLETGWGCPEGKGRVSANLIKSPTAQYGLEKNTGASLTVSCDMEL